MGTVTGSELLAQALKSQGVDALFYVMGGPMLETEATCIKLRDHSERCLRRIPVKWYLAKLTGWPVTPIGPLQKGCPVNIDS